MVNAEGKKLSFREAIKALSHQTKNVGQSIEDFLVESDQDVQDNYHYIVVTQLKQLIAKADMIEYEMKMKREIL